MMFKWYDNLCSLFLIELNKVIATPLLYICQVIGEKRSRSVTMLRNIRIGKVFGLDERMNLT